MKTITIIIQVFVKTKYLENLVNDLLEQINLLSNKYNFKILLWQDSLVGYFSKENDLDMITQFKKVNDLCQKLSEKKIIEFNKNDINRKPSKTCEIAINYSFNYYNTDYFILLEDDVEIFSNFLFFITYSLENLLTDTNIFVTGESIFFDTKENIITDKDINFNNNLISLFKLHESYTKFNFLPSTCFASDYHGWLKIKDIRGLVIPDGPVECCKLFKNNNYYTIFPIVPVCADRGMLDDYGYSRLVHKNNISEFKSTYTYSNDRIEKIKPFIFNKAMLFERTVKLLNTHNLDITIYQNCIINLGDVLSEYIFKYLGYNINVSSQFDLCNFLAIGSNLDRFVGVPNNNIKNVFSSGFMYSDQYIIPDNNISSVRGKLSAQKIKSVKNDMIVGDGALLLNNILDLNAVNEYRKHNIKFKLGIIPHISDINKTELLYNDKTNIKIIYINKDLSNFLYDCLECEYIVSSSLHGLIISDVLKIPNSIIKFNFSNRTNLDYFYKYNDYYSIYNYDNIQENNVLTENNNLDEIIKNINLNYKDKDIHNFSTKLQNKLKDLFIEIVSKFNKN